MQLVHRANAETLPEFLGIGAARAGTTWLSKVLSAHPNVWIPRVKELHYFTRSKKYSGPSHLSDPHLIRRFFGNEAHHKKYRHKVIKSLASNVFRPSVSKLRWDCNYLFGKPCDRWYGTLFSQGEGKLKGEITPRYSALETNDIERLKEFIPGIKLIFVVRNPIERAWSLLRYHEQRRRNKLSQLDVSLMLDLANDPSITEQSDYEKIFDRWEAVFPESQFLVLFYDDIVEFPEKVIRRLSEFLSLSERGFRESNYIHNRKVNAARGGTMPKELEAFLIEQYKPMIERLSSKFGGRYTEWLNVYSGQM